MYLIINIITYDTPPLQKHIKNAHVRKIFL
jgi:hypothetical protein